jgi:hypothetical protein
MVDEKKLTEPDFKNYKVLYMTEPDLPAEAMQSLLRWVNDGGTLVTVAGSGLFDRYHQPMDALTKSIGITVGAPIRNTYAAAAESGNLTSKGKTLSVFGDHEALQAAGATVLASFADGSPALVEKRLGQGRILRFACFPGLSYTKSGSGTTNGLASGFSDDWRQFIVQPVTAAKAVQPVVVDQAMIEAPALYSADGVAVTLLNWSGDTKEVEVRVRADKPVRRVETVEKGKLQFTTENGQVKVQLTLGDVDVLKLYY